MRGITPHLREFYKEKPSRAKGGRKILTSDVVFDHKEAQGVLEVILGGWISQGPRVKKFEEDFAEYYGSKYAISVNSGSSANLVALSVLTDETLGPKRIRPGDEVITSPVTFPTSVFPILQVGAVPVFVDVDPETLCMDVSMIEEAISEKTKAILPVHLLGHTCDMKGFSWSNHFLVEDVCESHGATSWGRKAGTFGDLGTFSFFTAHHMTTGEGGMIVTNDSKLANLAKSVRGFGRVIEVAQDPYAAQTLGDRYRLLSDDLGYFDIRQTFDRIGYALKMTDMQGAIGTEQLKKLDGFIETRRKNAEYMRSNLKSYSKWIQTPVERPWAHHTYHHFAMTVREDAPFSRLDIVNFLEAKGIETRPIEAGNMIDQPSMKGQKYRVVGDARNAKLIRKNSFFIGCHPGLTREDLEYVVNSFDEFFERTIKK
jgi:CDP-6-deoxy-D-xylo-4-hexulose-3-dehydrase